MQWGFNVEKIDFLRVPMGADLLQFIEDYANKNNIKTGIILGLGAVQKAVIGYYDQPTKKYMEKAIDEPMEIVNLTGNISRKDGKSMAHVHASFGKQDGAVVGGHLNRGTIVFACELKIIELSGSGYPGRQYDSETGLFLWAKE